MKATERGRCPTLSLQNLPRHRVQHADGPDLLRSHIDQLSVRSHFHAFGLFSDLRRFDHCAGSNVHYAHRRVILVRNKKLRAIFTDIEILRVRSRLENAHNFVLSDIENPDAIGGVVNCVSGGERRGHF